MAPEPELPDGGLGTVAEPPMVCANSDAFGTKRTCEVINNTAKYLRACTRVVLPICNTPNFRAALCKDVPFSDNVSDRSSNKEVPNALNPV